ncbi:MAG: hypothetical protein RM368_25935 [Nostoc sp. DedSLP03]|uniref:hypothetical protein n=1 Tax=Nostoc sp. DedSLP03 TaxID=3075400 RepID=UPI002AD27616|nr:hypothetical protein [Nostoc sp. DedSLP03]MDZ7968350.1 hypothetical protein [Nostoc sp. DedSLP03]
MATQVKTSVLKFFTLRFLKAYFASACGWRSRHRSKEKMGNTLDKNGERRGVMLEFEDACQDLFAQLVTDAP